MGPSVLAKVLRAKVRDLRRSSRMYGRRDTVTESYRFACRCLAAQLIAETL